MIDQGIALLKRYSTGGLAALSEDLFAGRLLGVCLLGAFFSIPLGITPPLIFGIAALIAWGASGLWRRAWRDWLCQPWTLPLFLFALLHALGLLWTTDLQNGLGFAEKSYYWLFTLAAASFPRTETHLKSGMFIHAYLAGLSINVLTALAQYIGLLPVWVYAGDGAPLYGFLGQHIAYSLLLVFGLLLLSRLWREETRRARKVVLVLLLCAYFMNLAISNGKIGYFAFVCLAPCLAYQLLGKKGRKWIPLLTLAVVLVLLFAPPVQTTLKRAAQGDKHVTSVVLRRFMWKGALKIFAEHPWIGVGTGGYRQAMIPYKTELSHYKENPEIESCCTQPHNSFLYAAANFGLIGLAVLLWLFAVFLKKGWKARGTQEGFAIFIYGCIMIIGSLTDTQIMSFSTAVLFALLLGLPIERSLPGKVKMS